LYLLNEEKVIPLSITPVSELIEEIMAEANKSVNYTPELTQKIVEMYKEVGNEGIEQIAEIFNRPIRSIRSKLVREGVYVATPKGAAVKAEGPSKKELLRTLEAKGFETEGFEGATKTALTRLLGLVAN
jgi:translation initiation factor 2 alpha subunit (eIF-2alpha)